MAEPKKPSQAALDYLTQNPGTGGLFKAKYGYLPEGFAAPKAALDFLSANPNETASFEAKYGYLPAAPAAPSTPAAEEPQTPSFLTRLKDSVGATARRATDSRLGAASKQAGRDFPSAEDLGTSARAGLTQSIVGLERQALEGEQTDQVLGLTREEMLEAYRLSQETDSPLPYPTFTEQDTLFYGPDQLAAVKAAGRIVSPTPLPAAGGTAAYRRGLQGNPEFIARQQEIEDVAATGREAAADSARLREENPSLIGRSALTAAASLPQSAAALGVGLATRNPALAAAAMAPGTQGSSYQNFREEGLKPGLARGAANIDAFIESATELLPFASVLKRDQGAFNKLAKFLAAELPGESIATITQELNGYLQTQPDDVTIGDVIEGFKRGAEQLPETWLSTLMGSSLQSGAVSGIQKTAEAAGKAIDKRKVQNEALESLTQEARAQLEAAVVAPAVPDQEDVPPTDPVQAAYKEGFAAALQETAGQPMPQSVALRYAQKKAMEAAKAEASSIAERSMSDETPEDVQVRERFKAAKEEVAEAQRAANDPNIKISRADIETANEALRQATVDYSRSLLRSGKLNREQQQEVAAALDRAFRAKPKAPKGKPTAAPAEETPAPAAAEATSPPALTEEQVAQRAETLAGLKTIAAAEEIEAGALNALVQQGLAKRNPGGKPLLTPAGRKLRTELEAAPATPAPKPAAKATPKAAPKAEPAKPAAPKVAVSELVATDYAVLERIEDGKPVATEEVQKLIGAGLVRVKADGRFDLKPAGKRQVREFRQNERQTPAEREFTPAIEKPGLPLGAKERISREDRAAAKAEKQAKRKAGFEAAEAERAKEAERIEVEKKRAFDAKQNADADEAIVKANASESGGPAAATPLAGALETAQKTAAQKKAAAAVQEEAREAQDMTDLADLTDVLTGRATAGTVGRLADLKLVKKNNDGTGTMLPAGRRRMLELQRVPPRSEKSELRKAKKAGVVIEEGPDGFTLRTKSGEPIATTKTREEADVLAAEIPTERKKGKGRTTRAAGRGKVPGMKVKVKGVKELPGGIAVQGLTEEQAKDAAGKEGEVARSIAESESPAAKKFKAYVDQQKKDRELAAFKKENERLIARRKMADKVAAALKRELGVDLRVATNAANLPEYLRRLGLMEETDGLFFRTPSGETEVWLIADGPDNRTERAMMETALHEVVGHMGLRGLLGENYDATMREIRRSFPKEVRAAARRNRIAITANAHIQKLAPEVRRSVSPQELREGARRAAQKGRNLAAEELVAYATGRILEFSPSKRQLTVWDRIVDVVRTALRTLGVISDFSAKDIERLVLRARDYVARETKQQAQAAYEDVVAAAVKPDALRFKHFSNLTEEEVMLDPKYMGTGLKGRESLRTGPKVTSLYPEDLSDSDIEYELRGKTKYVVEVPRDALYDASEDPMNLRMKAQRAVGWTEEDGVRVPTRFTFDATKFEQLILEAGFDGYYTPAAAGILRGQARLFKLYPARRAAAEEALASVANDVTLSTNGNTVTVSVQGGEMTAEIMRERGYLWVKSANVPSADRGKGLGVAMAQRLVNEAYALGLKFTSDSRVSDNAARVYDSLSKRGYGIKRNPARRDKGTGELISVSELKPVFEVTGGELMMSVGATKTGPLLGMPRKATIPGRGEVVVGPFQPARDAAAKYREQSGIGSEAPRNYVKVDPEFATDVAKAFDKMKHQPSDPKVRAAYAAMIEETLAQYQVIKATGLKIELITGEDPYAASPRLAIEDVKNNNHLWVFPTDAGFGNADAAQYAQGNPMLEPTSEKIGDRVLLANDVFRIVHDYFGHIKEGNGFRADGEENAWRIHASMYSPLARAAMTTETRGQNSWLNYGPFAEKNRTAKSADTIYAPQKIGLLPKEFWADPAEQLSPARQAAQKTITKVAKFLTREERTMVNQATAKKLVSLFKQLPSEKELAAAAIAGQAKRGWYRQSAEAIVNIFGADAPRFAALLAAFSPQTSVEGNLDNTVRTWKNWTQAGRPTDRKSILRVLGQSVQGSKGAGSVLGAWQNNTVRALSSQDPEGLSLSGPKVDSFAANLRGEVNAVTLDTWMANFALVEQKIFTGTLTKDGTSGKRFGYLAYSARIRQTAQYLTEQTGESWTPAEVQETVWSWAKALTEEAEAMGAMTSAREIIENEELTDALINATPDFATLFRNEQYEKVLREAGYGEQLDRLAGSQANDQPGGQRQKVAPLAGDRERLLNAAGRLDKLIEQRREAKKAERLLDEEGEPEIAYSILGGNTGNQDLDSFLDKFGAPRRTLRQMWQDLTQNLKDRLAQQIFDHFHGVKRAEALAGISAADSGYISLRLAQNSAELVQAMMEYGHPVWNGGAADIAGGQGLMQILKPLGDNVNLFLAYLVGKRAGRLITEGRENLFTQAEIDAAVDLGNTNPEFKVVAARYAQFQSKVLDFAEQAGVIDPAARTLWENADYVPFYRIVQNGQVQQSTNAGSLGKIRNQINRLRGGQANLGDPLENIVRNWLALVDASLKARAVREIVDNLNGTGLVQRAPQFEFTSAIVPLSEVKKFIANNPTLAATLNAVGLDPSKLPPAAFAGLQKMLAVQAPTDEDVISVWRNGKREYWRIQDALLFQSLQEASAKAWGPWIEFLAYPKRLFTATVTSTPQFALKNLWRDMWHAFVQGTEKGAKIPMIPIVDSVKGTISQVRMDPTSRSLLAGGGTFTHGYVRAGDTEGSVATVRGALRSSTITGRVLNSPRALWTFYRDMMNAAENAHRVQIYKRSLAVGKTRKEALYDARDMLDFAMKGANPVVQFLVASVPFMNARLQGLYRLGRGFKADFVAVGLRGLLLTAATLGVFGAFGDDDRYRELTKEQKTTYWHFWDVLEKGDHWKLPKPFEVGTIFGTVPEAILDAAITNADEPDAAMQSIKLLGFSFSETLNMSPQVQTVWPILELAINKDTFREAPILTLGDENVLPEYQDGPRVSPTYRALAHAMPEIAPEALRSPKQLEHLGRGYIGNIQDYALLATDYLVRKARGEPDAPDRGSDWPGLRDFRTSGPSRNTKYVNSLYEIAAQADKVAKSIKRLEDRQNDQADLEIERLETEKAPLLDVVTDYREAVERVNAMREEQRNIQLDPDMKPEDKRKEIDAIQLDINEEAREMWDLRPGGKLNPTDAGKLIGATLEKQTEILEGAGLPATAELLRLMG